MNYLIDTNIISEVRKGAQCDPHVAAWYAAVVERMRRCVSQEATLAIQKALESAGIKFIDENGGGPGVRLKKRER